MSKYLCIICGREFKQKCHLDNHNNKKVPCVIIEKQNDNQNIRKELEQVKNENEQVKNENEQLKKEIEELKNTKDIVIKDVNINSNNNINITNNFNVIKIIDHGKEDYTKLDIKKIMLENQILPKLNYISTIIYYVHCNDEYPEYQNIYISDASRNKAMIYHDGKWISADKVSTMDNLFNSIVNCVDTITEESSAPDTFSNYITEIKRVNPFGKLYTKKNKKTAMNNSENVLYDNKEKIKTIKNVKPKSIIIKQIDINKV
jgi:hypothetical protein